MMQQQKWFEMVRVARLAMVAATLGMAWLTIASLPADARGGHGIGRGSGGHATRGAEFTGGRRHGNDIYIKNASDEPDKLLNAKLKSICRGC
jgi:hypothetical protein